MVLQIRVVPSTWLYTPAAVALAAKNLCFVLHSALLDKKVIYPLSQWYWFCTLQLCKSLLGTGFQSQRGCSVTRDLRSSPWGCHPLYPVWWRLPFEWSLLLGWKRAAAHLWLLIRSSVQVIQKAKRKYKVSKITSTVVKVSNYPSIRKQVFLCAMSFWDLCWFLLQGLEFTSKRSRGVHPLLTASE